MKHIYTILACIIINSCTQLSVNNNRPRDVWNILDNFNKTKWNKNKIIDNFGQPADIIKDNKYGITWSYDDIKTSNQLWIFGFDKKGNVDTVIYIPTSYNRLEFSLENIKGHWKKYHCKDSEKEELHPDYIKTIYYLKCNPKNYYAEFNKYHEVSLISVSK